MRVLVLTTRFPDRHRPNLGNFVERQTLALAIRPGVEVEVVAPLGRMPAPLPRGWRVSDGLPQQENWKGLAVHRPRFVQIRHLPSLRPGTLARRLLPLAEAMRKRFPFDVISAEFFWPDGPAAISVGQALGVPVVIKARGMEFENRVRIGSTRRQLLAAGNAAQTLLAVSDSVKATMVTTGLPADRIAVHYPGVDTNFFRLGDKAAAKAKLGVSGTLLLAVGNLIPEKGHALAVAALSQLTGATLVVAGNGPEGSKLLALAQKLGVAGRLRLLGSVPHASLPDLYTAADVTVHASRIEGFGNVFLESLACGTPLIITAAGHGPKLISRPEIGRVVDADAEAIAAGVRSVMAASPDVATRRARACEFGWERNTDGLIQHLNAAVASGWPPTAS